MANAYPRTYEHLVIQVDAAAVSCDAGRLREAWETAQKAYDGHEHWGGMTLLDHVLSVLDTLLPLKPDEDAVIACLLHHVLHTKYWSLTDLEQHFGPTVRELVSGVHLLSHVTLQDRRMSIEDLRLMLLTVSSDVRTVVIILCDRLTMLRHVDSLPAEEARRVAQDVLQLFAPVAARLGIYTLKHELEAEAFPVSYPHDAERIADQILQMHAKAGDFISRTIPELKAYLEGQGIPVEIEAREKQPYSVFRKCVRRA